MKIVVVLFDLLAAAAGIYAALLWLRASQVIPVPPWGNGCEPGDEMASQGGWISGQLVAGTESSRLNAEAAKWTAGAVALGAIGNIAGVF